MNAVFYASLEKVREQSLAQAFADGLRPYDATAEVKGNFDQVDPEADVAAVFAIKGRARNVLDAYRAAGKHTILFDKALIRSAGVSHRYFRVCLDADSPHRYIMRVKRPAHRWEALGVDVEPRKSVGPGGAVVLALSSQKYCDFHGLGDATEYARGLVADIRKRVPGREIVYRPKPSWNAFRPIVGTRLSRPPETMADLLPRAHVVVTHGASAAIDAVIAGVPAITLGECAATPVSGKLKHIAEPTFPIEERRMEWLANLAWCQWSLSEIRSGEMWAFIQREIEAL